MSVYRRDLFIYNSHSTLFSHSYRFSLCSFYSQSIIFYVITGGILNFAHHLNWNDRLFCCTLFFLSKVGVMSKLTSYIKGSFYDNSGTLAQIKVDNMASLCQYSGLQVRESVQKCLLSAISENTLYFDLLKTTISTFVLTLLLAWEHI